MSFLAKWANRIINIMNIIFFRSSTNCCYSNFSSLFYNSTININPSAICKNSDHALPFQLNLFLNNNHNLINLINIIRQDISLMLLQNYIFLYNFASCFQTLMQNNVADQQVFTFCNQESYLKIRGVTKFKEFWRTGDNGRTLHS